MAVSNKVICDLALSKLRISGGIKSPRLEDETLALITLQSYFRYLISSGALGRSRAVRPCCDVYIAHENDRILRTDDVNEITLPEQVQDCISNPYGLYGDNIAWYDGIGDYGALGFSSGDRRLRFPRNGSFVIINEAKTGQTQEFIYDGYVNQWLSIADMTLDDNTPLTTQDGTVVAYKTSLCPLSQNSNGLAARLAMLLADHFGAQLQQTTVSDGQHWEAAQIQGFGEHEYDVPGRYY